MDAPANELSSTADQRSNGNKRPRATCFAPRKISDEANDQERTATDPKISPCLSRRGSEADAAAVFGENWGVIAAISLLTPA